MFGLFKKKKKELVLFDIDGDQLVDGDIVICLRHELGESKFVKTENGFEYQSLEKEKGISWLKMIDAATERQKVRKKSMA